MVAKVLVLMFGRQRVHLASLSNYIITNVKEFFKEEKVRESPSWERESE